MATDCLSVINSLKDQNLGRYSHILHEIKAIARGFAETCFVHEPRSSNKEPHMLAHSVMSSPVGRYVWLIDPPAGVCIPHILML